MLFSIALIFYVQIVFYYAGALTERTKQHPYICLVVAMTWPFYFCNYLLHLIGKVFD